MAWKVKSPEEARECGRELGESAGLRLRREVDAYIEEENLGLAREREEKFWRNIEEASQKRVGRLRQVITLHGARWDVIFEPPKVSLKGQDTYDALLSGYKEGARAAFGQS